jgi:hypothetical protein
MDHTQGEVNHADGQVPKPSALDDLLGVSSTSMDVDPSSVNGVLCQRGDRIKCIHASAAGGQGHRPSHVVEQHQQEFPRLALMTRQYLAVTAISSSPERLFSSVGFVKSDWWCSR